MTIHLRTAATSTLTPTCVTRLDIFRAFRVHGAANQKGLRLPVGERCKARPLPGHPTASVLAHLWRPGVARLGWLSIERRRHWRTSKSAPARGLPGWRASMPFEGPSGPACGENYRIYSPKSRVGIMASGKPPTKTRTSNEDGGEG